MLWFARRGATVYTPFGHSPDVDLVADMDGRLLRVQVKTCRQERRGRYSVALATRGGNQSWSGIVKRFDASRFDVPYVAMCDGRRWRIPADRVQGTTSIELGGPKYSEYEVARGEPL